MREAACAALAEFAARVDPAAVEPLLPRVLRALLLAAKDASWLVGDGGGGVCGCVWMFLGV